MFVQYVSWSVRRLAPLTDRKIRVVVTKPGLDGYDRGAKIIARGGLEGGGDDGSLWVEVAVEGRAGGAGHFQDPLDG
jgi:hypothetical protein